MCKNSSNQTFEPGEVAHIPSVSNLPMATFLYDPYIK